MTPANWGDGPWPTITARCEQRGTIDDDQSSFSCPTAARVPRDGSATTVVVEHTTGTKYVATVRGHEVRVDQPLTGGGTDEAPTPVELFVVSLATCMAYFAGLYLQRHGVSRAGLAVHAEYRKTDKPPARVASIHLQAVVPAGLPVDHAKRLHAVLSHCTVHNTLRKPPMVDIKIDGEPVMVAD
jgi:putative redox protein